MTQTVLSLFMAGVLQPKECSSVDELMATYVTAVRQAFREKIDSGDKSRERLTSLGSDINYDPESALDHAFAEAEKIAKKRVSRERIHLDRLASELGGFESRTRQEMEREEQQSYLSAAGLHSPHWDQDEDERDPEEIWHNGLVPIDAQIFAERCHECASRTTHMATSRIGQHEILESACFCQLNQARAIGGAVSVLVANVRDGALADPNDQFSRDAVTLCSNTVFRFLLRSPRKVAPQCPDSIVPCTLFFLHDCRWLRSGAALLMQLAEWWMPVAERGKSAPVVAVAHAMNDIVHRPHLLRSDDGVGMLLALDATLQAAELLRGPSSHPHPHS